MPFDSKPTLTTLDKLKHVGRLLEMADDSDQGSWCSCLFHQVATDHIFIEAGLDISELNKFMEPSGTDMMKMWEFLGHPNSRYADLFSSGSVNYKKKVLHKIILTEETRARCG